MPVLVRRSPDTGYIILISILAFPSLLVAAMFLFCLCKRRRHQAQHDALGHSLPLVPPTVAQSNCRPSTPLRPPLSRRSSKHRTIPSLQQKIRRMVEQKPAGVVITPPALVHSRPHQEYNIPGAESNDVCKIHPMPGRPSKRLRKSHELSPRMKKSAPEYARLDEMHRRTLSPPQPSSKHQAFRKQAAKSFLPQTMASTPPRNESKEAMLGSHGSVHRALWGRMTNGATEVVIGQTGRRKHINSAYATHLRQKKARKPSMPPELYASDDGEGTTEVGDTPSMTAKELPYIKPPGAPYIAAAESTPHAETPAISAAGIPPVSSTKTPYINGFRKPPFLRPDKTRDVKTPSSLDPNTNKIPQTKAAASTAPNPPSSSHSPNTLPNMPLTEPTLPDHAHVTKGATHRPNTPKFPYTPLHITTRGGRRDYDQERAQKARLRALLGSPATTVDAASPHSERAAVCFDKNTIPARPSIDAVTLNGESSTGSFLDAQYPAMMGIRNAGAAVGRTRDGEYGEVDIDVEVENELMPLPLRIRGMGNEGGCE